MFAVLCLKCGAPHSQGARFCKACGAPLAESVAPSPPPAPVEQPVTARSPEVHEPGPTVQVSQPVDQAAAAAWQASASILKDGPRLLVRHLLARLPLAILTFVPAWLVHTYLLVVKNEGFTPDTPLSSFINTSGNAASSVVIWGLTSAMVWSLLLSFLRCGPARTLQSLLAAPGRVIDLLRRNDKTELTALALGATAAMLLSDWFSVNRPAGFLLTLSSLFLGMGYSGAILARMAAELYRRSVNDRARQSLDQMAAFFQAVLAGMPMGFFVVTMFSAATASRLAYGLILLSAALFFMKKKGRSGTPPPQAAAAFLFALGAGLFFVAVELLLGRAARADDGGLYEATKSTELTWSNITTWWGSEGAKKALLNGVAPSVAATLGAVMPPPLVPPTTGLDYKEDVTVEKEKDEEKFYYNLALNSQTSKSLPADGRTPAYGYTVGETNDPKVKPRSIALGASFSTTAPTGFELRVVSEEVAFGGECKQVTVVAVPPTDAAYAPGEIPGVVYAEGSAPDGRLLRDHLKLSILVGTGKLHIEPLERSWLRADGQDSFNLTAWIEPTHGAQITDEERKSTLELATYGPNANWIGVSAPGDGEFYRYWTVQAAEAPDPKSMPQPLQVELGLQGRFAGGLFQEKIMVDMLAPPRVQGAPEAPFLVPKLMESTEVKLSVQGAAPKEEWSFETEYKSGNQSAIPEPELTAEPPASATLTFKLGDFQPDQGPQRCTYRITASEKKSGAEAEELLLTVTATRPGVVILSDMPFSIRADGKAPGQKEQRLKVTVLRWNDASKTMEPDEKAMSNLKFEVPEEDAPQALKAAEPAFEFVWTVGEQTNKHAVWKARSRFPVPGTGSVTASMDVSVPGESEPEFTQSLGLKLLLDAAALQHKKDQEWALLMDVLYRYFKKPYDDAKEEDKANLARLVEIYDKLKPDLEKKRPTLGAADMFELRRSVLKIATSTWESVGNLYMADAIYYEQCLKAAMTVDWLMDNMFQSVVKAACATAGVPWYLQDFAALGPTLLRRYISKFIGERLNGTPAPEIWADIWKDIKQSAQDFALTDAPEQALQKMLGDPAAPGAEPGKNLKFYALVYGSFIVYRYYQNYYNEDPVTGEQPTGYWRSFELTSQDVGMKVFQDFVFEKWLEGKPFRRGGSPGGGPGGGPSGGSGGDAGGGPSGGPSGGSGGDAGGGPSGGPSGGSGGDAGGGPSGGPSGGSGGDAGGGPSGGPSGGSGGDAGGGPSGGPSGGSGGDAGGGPSGGPSGGSGGDAGGGPSGGPSGGSGGDAGGGPSGGSAGDAGGGPSGGSGGDAGGGPSGGSGGDAGGGSGGDAGGGPSGGSGGDVGGGPSSPPAGGPRGVL